MQNNISNENNEFMKKRTHRCDKEEGHDALLLKSYQKLEEMKDIIASSEMGTWKIYLLDGQDPKMEADDLMLKLLGLEGQELTPEEIYKVWFSNITLEAMDSVQASMGKMTEGERDENTYIWNHPVLGPRYVRCGGVGRAVEGGIIYRGYHYDVDEDVRRQKKKDRELLEQQEKRLKEAREHAEVITSLSTIYSTIFRADLDSHHYEVLTTVDSMLPIAGREGNFDDVKAEVLKTFMAQDMRPFMDDFLDINTLADRLQNTNTIETEYKNPAGQWMKARFIVKRRDAAGRAKEVLYVAHDCTEEKIKEFEQKECLAQALAASRQASKAKSTFLSNMSHDIRTPMNAIMGFTALAQAHIDDTDLVKDYLAKISTSGAHLLSLINDILDMSRIESGAVKLEENLLHLPDIFDDLRVMTQGMVTEKNLHLHITSQDMKHENVITDKLRLNQVLLNIVGNAIKFTGPGGDIWICAREKVSQRVSYTSYEFTVKDSGIGMSKEFMDHIFETFTRENSVTVSGIQGTGLGMAITKNIVTMMGGDIRVESEEGKGSIFTVTLNFKLPKDEIAREEASEKTEASATTDILNYDYRGKRALLVEDNELNAEIARAILEETGMTIDCVNDGDLAVETLRKAPADYYDLVFMDIQMPKMDGYTATREIRTLDDNHKANIPIVAMTANAFEEDKQKAFACGMNGHIIKPVSIENIAHVLDEIFGKKEN